MSKTDFDDPRYFLAALSVVAEPWLKARRKKKTTTLEEEALANVLQRFLDRTDAGRS
jgi:hypothetical protein